MLKKMKIVKDVDVKYLVANVGVRYWEDAEVNGIQDNDDNPTIPGVVNADGEKRWEIEIDVDKGIITGWPYGTSASVHFKICDDGKYMVLDADRNRLHAWEDYVPDCLNTDDGDSDYVVLEIDNQGKIEDWDFSDFEIPEPDQD